MVFEYFGLAGCPEDFVGLFRQRHHSLIVIAIPPDSGVIIESTFNTQYEFSVSILEHLEPVVSSEIQFPFLLGVARTTRRCNCLEIQLVDTLWCNGRQPTGGDKFAIKGIVGHSRSTVPTLYQFVSCRASVDVGFLIKFLFGEACFQNDFVHLLVLGLLIRSR